jgi:hypothetical protein
VKKLKSSSKNKLKLGRLLISTLLIAVVFQATAISMVQATSDADLRSTLIQPSPDSAVVVSNENPNLIATQDNERAPLEDSVVTDDVPVTSEENPNLIATEDGEKVPFENSTITRDEEIKTIIPDDDSTIGVSENNQNEDYQPLIAPSPQAVNSVFNLGFAVMLATVAVCVAVIGVLVVRGSKKRAA